MVFHPTHATPIMGLSMIPWNLWLKSLYAMIIYRDLDLFFFNCRGLLHTDVLYHPARIDWLLHFELCKFVIAYSAPGYVAIEECAALEMRTDKFEPAKVFEVPAWSPDCKCCLWWRPSLWDTISTYAKQEMDTQWRLSSIFYLIAVLEDMSSYLQ